MSFFCPAKTAKIESKKQVGRRLFVIFFSADGTLTLSPLLHLFIDYLTMSERKRIARAFKMRGLSIQSSALDALLNVLSREQEQELVGSSVGNRRRNGDDALLAIIDEMKERMIHSGGCSSNRNNIVTSALLEEVVAELSRDAKDVTDEALQLLDAFRTPRLEYDAMRKTFSLVDGKQRSLYGEAVDKVCRVFIYSDIV